MHEHLQVKIFQGRFYTSVFLNCPVQEEYIYILHLNNSNSYTQTICRESYADDMFYDYEEPCRRQNCDHGDAEICDAHKQQDAIMKELKSINELPINVSSEFMKSIRGGSTKISEK